MTLQEAIEAAERLSEYEKLELIIALAQMLQESLPENTSNDQVDRKGETQNDAAPND